MELNNLISLPAEEEKRFSEFIRKARNSYIIKPQETVDIVVNDYKQTVEQYIEEGKLSDLIVFLREKSFEYFLSNESDFNAYIFKSITDKFEIPKYKFNQLCQKIDINAIKNIETLKTEISEIFGEYSGYISPYIYQLCLSNTNSRRSRAGKVFESIIYYIYKHFNYKFESQVSIGSAQFSAIGMGKVVDSILPGIQEFKERRDKTIIGTMKTTLRERWQEVVEEVSRSNLPNIYLLTVDDDIGKNKAEQMSKHNIILVVHKNVKAKEHLINRRNVVDFENYFLEELPSIFKYWNKHDKSN